MSITLPPPKPLGEIWRNLLHDFPHGKGVREQHYLSIQHRSVQQWSICPSGYLLPNHWAEFNQTLKLHDFLSWWGLVRMSPLFCLSVCLAVMLSETLAWSMEFMMAGHWLCILVAHAFSKKCTHASVHSDVKLHIDRTDSSELRNCIWTRGINILMRR